MNDFKQGPSLVWDEDGKFRDQKWPDLKARILNIHGGIGIIVDDFIEMLRYKGAPFGHKTTSQREAFSDLTLDAIDDEDIVFLADILSVMMREPWKTNVDGGWFIASLRKKETHDEFDAPRAASIINHLYRLHEYPALVLCKTLTSFVESYDEPLITLWEKMLRTGMLRREIVISMQPITVFISYAKEDSAKAENLRGDLERKAAIKAWKDTHELLPGERWETKIKKSLKENDFVILCLSKASVAKTGFFQVEVKEALRWQQYRPTSRVYIIPIRLDECELPPEIEELQYVNMFPNWENSVEVIIKALLEHKKLYPTSTGTE